MLLTRWVTWRSLISRPMRTLLSSFGIMLGVAGMFAISATNQVALRSISNLFQGTAGRVSLEIHSADNTSSFREAILQKVIGVPGLEVAAPLIKLQTALVEKDRKASLLDISMFGASTSNLLLYGIDPQLDPKIRDYKLVRGRFLSSDPSAFEAVLVYDYAADHELSVGDRILVQTSEGPAKLKVVGLMAKEGPGLLNLGNFGVVSLQTAQKLKGLNNEIDQIDLLANTGTSDPEMLKLLAADVQARLGTSTTVLFPANQGERMTQMLSGFQVGLNFMGMIALFVGAFLVYNAFSMTVVERSREFSMLRVIGLTRRQIMSQVLFEGVLLGIFGVAFGAGLGILMERGLIRIMGSMTKQPLDAGEIPLPVLAFSMAIGLAITIAAAVIPAAQAARVSPLEALRQRSKSQGKLLERVGFPVGLALLVGSTVFLVWNPFPYDVQFRLGSIAVFSLFFGAMLLVPMTTGVWERLARKPFQLIYGSAGEIGARNLERSRLRTMLTAAALLIGVSMIVVIQGITASFSTDLRSWMEAYIGGDLYVNSSVLIKRDLQYRIEAVDGVAAAVPLRYLEVTWKTNSGTDEKINFMGIDPQAYTSVTHFVFSDPVTNANQAVEALSQSGNIFVSSVIAEKYGVKLGDILELQTRTGVKPFQVVSIVMDFYNRGMVVTGNWEDMRRFFHTDDATFILIKVQDGHSIEATRDLIDSLYGKRYNLSLDSNLKLKEQALGLLDQAFSMFSVLGIMAVLVAALGIVNTLTMSVMERTQEIGMLRSIGMTRWQIVRMVLAEAGLLGVIGGLLGLVFGLLLTRVFLTSMAAMSGYSLNLTIPASTIWTAVVVALVVSQVAAMLPASRAARIPVLEAIHYE